MLAMPVIDQQKAARVRDAESRDNSMTEDVLGRIQREMHERLRELRCAVEEHDRLVADLEAR